MIKKGDGKKELIHCLDSIHKCDPSIKDFRNGINVFIHYVMFRSNCLLHFVLNDENVDELLVESENEFHAIIEE